MEGRRMGQVHHQSDPPHEETKGAGMRSDLQEACNESGNSCIFLDYLLCRLIEKLCFLQCCFK
jgi:hypothetical protein